jgi:N utilization substance protein B
VIELAKRYSTDKSGIFINGMLDAITADLKNEGLVRKTGRGLIE